MRKLVAIMFMTLDGVIQAPGGPEEDTSGGFKWGGWSFPYADDFTGKVMQEQMKLEGTEMLLGRKTYEIFANYWPTHAGDWPGINDVKKYVASNDSSFKLEWQNSTLLTGDVVGEVKKMKQDGGPDLHVWGSANLLQSLMKADLIDEYWLKIHPLTLGSGKKLFAEGTIPAALKLTDCKVSPKGVIIANYERDGEVKTGSFVD
jgi:dihydrofolate reductase